MQNWYQQLQPKFNANMLHEIQQSKNVLKRTLNYYYTKFYLNLSDGQSMKDFYVG